MCINSRDIHAQTVKDAYPVTSMDSILDKLRGAKYISQIDLKNAYLQVPMEQNSKNNTAFSVPEKGLYQFVTMSFGLANVPATFFRLVDALFGPEFEPNVFANLDDIIVVSSTYEEHLQWLKFVLDRLVTAGLKINQDKCEFCCSCVTYLGFLLDEEESRPDPEKTAPVMDYPVPKNIKELRRLLEIMGWYSRFIQREPEYKAPLTKLLHKKQSWEWGNEQDL